MDSWKLQMTQNNMYLSFNLQPDANYETLQILFKCPQHFILTIR